MAKTPIDPVTLVVIQNGLQQVCNEMDLAFCRAAFSPVISEALDRSDGIYHGQTGELIAQGELGLPVFVGTMQFSTQAVIERALKVPLLAPKPGDVYIVNDPYLGGTHRSEEHTSELQSLMRISYAVFCLKKKKRQTSHEKKS